MDTKKFEEKIKPLLTYVGTIGAVLMAIAYVAIVFIMVFGFYVDQSFSQTLGFAIVNAVIGLIIMQLLKVQGIDLAKNLDTNQEILKEYQNTKTKDKINHSISYFWITSLLKDFLLKALGIAVTTMGIIYVVIQGSNNYSLLLLAIVNLIMFACFGLLNLVKAYDFFNEQHIPYIVETLNNEKQKKEQLIEQESIERETMIEKEVQRRVNLVLEEIKSQNSCAQENTSNDSEEIEC